MSPPIVELSHAQLLFPALTNDTPAAGEPRDNAHGKDTIPTGGIHEVDHWSFAAAAPHRLRHPHRSGARERARYPGESRRGSGSGGGAGARRPSGLLPGSCGSRPCEEHCRGGSSRQRRPCLHRVHHSGGQDTRNHDPGIAKHGLSHRRSVRNLMYATGGLAHRFLGQDAGELLPDGVIHTTDAGRHFGAGRCAEGRPDPYLHRHRAWREHLPGAITRELGNRTGARGKEFHQQPAAVDVRTGCDGRFKGAGLSLCLSGRPEPCSAAFPARSSRAWARLYTTNAQRRNGATLRFSNSTSTGSM